MCNALRKPRTDAVRAAVEGIARCGPHLRRARVEPLPCARLLVLRVRLQNHALRLVKKPGEKTLRVPGASGRRSSRNPPPRPAPSPEAGSRRGSYSRSSVGRCSPAALRLSTAPGCCAAQQEKPSAVKTLTDPLPHLESSAVILLLRHIHPRAHQCSPALPTVRHL